MRNEKDPGILVGVAQPPGAPSAKRNAAFSLPHLHAGMSIVDVGCGPGTITIGLAEVVAPGAVNGIDLDKDAISRALSAVMRFGFWIEFRAACLRSLWRAGVGRVLWD